MKRYLLVILLIMGCSSAPQLKRLYHNKTVTIKYIIQYPDYSGMVKSHAKIKRKKYMDSAVVQIYASIYRLAYYGRSDFNPDDFSGLSSRHLYIYKFPFQQIASNPPTLRYNGEYNYGYLEEKSSSYGVHVWSYPLAETKDSEYLVTSNQIEKKVNHNILILKKRDLTSLLNKFYENHNIFNAKGALANFLNRHAYKFVKHHRPIDSLFEMFKRYKSFKSGSGLSDEMENMPNSLSFSLDQEINRQFIWGLVLLLNSEVSAKRINKQKLEVTVNIPIENILKNNMIKPLSQYIE